MHNYHGTYEQFPLGAVKYRNYEPPGSSNRIEYDRYTWLTLSLPYIEQDNLYKKWPFKYYGPPGNVGIRSSGQFTLPATGDLATGAIASQPVKTFLCPSDPAISQTSPYGVATDPNKITRAPTCGRPRPMRRATPA